MQFRVFTMTRQGQEKFPAAKIGDTVMARISDFDRGRCKTQETY